MNVPITEPELLPKVSGIYLVRSANGEVVYIGKANNIYQRWKNGHHKFSEIVKECGTEAYISWTEVPKWLLNRAEHSAVSFYKPKLNLKMPSIV